MRKYGGYISAINKDKECNSQYCVVEVDSPTRVVAKLMEQCLLAYPESEGWRSHATSQSEGIVIY